MPSFLRGLRQLSVLGTIGLVITLIIVTLVMIGPLIQTHDPEQISNDTFQAPSLDHWFGTDNYGRDYYSRTLGGGRITLAISLASVIIGTTVGVTLGMCSAYLRGMFDMFFQRLVDTMLALPGLILAMFFVTIFGRGVSNLILVIGLLVIPGMIRVSRASTLLILTKPYIESGRVVGASAPRLLLRHVLPNIAPTIAVIVTTAIGSLMLVTAGLGFLGLGVQPPTSEWGRMLADSRTYAVTAPWLALYPGLLISFTVIGVNLLGDSLRDKWDPSLRS